MVLKKQTIWLLTMLTLMVALSAYYLLKEDSSEIAITDNNPYTQSMEEQMGMENDDNFMSNLGIDITTTQSTNTENMFASLRLERDQFRAQLMEKYNNIVANSKDNNAVAEASAKMEELDMLEGNENLVESLIKAKGFADAVVYTLNQQVNVIVQKENLNKEEAVTIINLVAKNMNIPGTSVKVNNVP